MISRNNFDPEVAGEEVAPSSSKVLNPGSCSYANRASGATV